MSDFFILLFAEIDLKSDPGSFPLTQIAMDSISNTEDEVNIESLNGTNDESNIFGLSLDVDEDKYVASSMGKIICDPFLNELVQRDGIARSIIE